MVFSISHNTSQWLKHNSIYDVQKNQKRDDLDNKRFIYTDKRDATDNLHGSYSINQRSPAEQSRGYEDGSSKGPGPPLLVAADF